MSRNNEISISVKDAIQCVLESTDGDIDGGESPYFDSLLGRPIEVPPSVRCSVSAVLHSDEGGASDPSEAIEQVVCLAALKAARDVLDCYEKNVRPAVMGRIIALHDGGEGPDRDDESELEHVKFVPGGGSVLLRYEIFLSTLVSASNVTAEDGSLLVHELAFSDSLAGNGGCGIDTNRKDPDGWNSDDDDEGLIVKNIRSLCCAIFTLSSDVIRLTASDQVIKSSEVDAKEDNVIGEQRREARNIVLPALLRILSHAVNLLGIHAHYLQKQSGCDRNSSERVNREQSIGTIGVTLAIVTLVAAAFTDGNRVDQSSAESESSLSPTDLSPCLGDELSPSRSVSSCSYPPVPGSSWDFLLAECNGGCGEHANFLRRPVVNLDGASMPSPWQDNLSGVGQRAGMELLRAILKPSLASIAAGGALESVHENQQDWTLLRRIAHRIGQETMAKVVRAHFFGRLTSLSRKMATGSKGHNSGVALSVAAASTRRPWYSPPHSTREHTSKVPETVSHSRIPSRVHSCLRAVCSFRFPDVTSPVLDDFLPICYTLIDSHDTVHQALGAAALLHLLKECTAATFAPHKEFSGKVLELGCRTCRDAAALAVLSRTRAALFESFVTEKGLDSSSSSAAPRRKATYDLLALVRMQRGDDKPLVAGVLVGGIDVLLDQHANLPDADAMEILRSGLVTLLPLIRWDGSDAASRTVQLAALAGLVSLLMGAHPLAPRHGGKIMSEVLSCLGRSGRDLSIGEKVRGGVDLRSGVGFIEHIAAKAVSALAIHVASVALVLCGERAEAVLLSVEGGGYESSLVLSCSKIRDGSKVILEREKANGGQCRLPPSSLAST